MNSNGGPHSGSPAQLVSSPSNRTCTSPAGGRRTVDRRSDLAQQPRRPDQRMPGERQLDLGGEDPHLASPSIVNEHRLGEAEIGRDRLALGLGHRSAVEEDAERGCRRCRPRAQKTRTTCSDRPARAEPVSGESGGGR